MAKKQKQRLLIIPFESDEFMKLWIDLIQEPKWKNKSDRALQMALDKMAEYSEDVAIQAMKNAILGNYQGIFPESVKLNQINGKQINSNSNTTNLDRAAELALRILSQPQSNISN